MEATLPSPSTTLLNITHLFFCEKGYAVKRERNRERERERGGERAKQAMALQASAGLRSIPLPLSPGLRRVSDCHVLKSTFFSPSLLLLLPPSRRPPPAAAPKFSMRVASKQAYICRDCGYIYNERTPFEKQPDEYFCPVCGAPKRRFRAYEPAVTKNANATDVRKARKEQLKRDEAIGKALPITIVAGIAALAGLYFYLNNAV